MGRRCTPGGIRTAITAAAIVIVALAPAALAQELNGSISRLLTRHGLTASDVAVSILDADQNRVLAAHNDDKRLIPASNMKLLTSGAAISVLGPEFAFRTELLRDGDRLIIRGDGDPALADPTLLARMGMGVEAFITAWTDAAIESQKEHGPIREVIADDRVFDRDFVHPSWPIEQLNRWYCAQVAGLNFQTNCLNVYARPARSGAPPDYTVEPHSPWIDIENKANSASSGSNTLWASRAHGGNDITLFGAVRWPLESPLEITIHDPPAYLADLVADRLRSRGVPAAVARTANQSERFPEARTIALVRTPIDVALERCNVNSQNLFAEALLKRIGHAVSGQPGTWQNGAAVIRMEITDRLGPADSASVVVADGSGMSRDNRVTTGVLTRWLRSLADDPRTADPFILSLPLAQNDGTLRRRFSGKALDLEVRAKTGYLREVSSLSGYVIDPTSDRRIAFSVIVNGFPKKVPLSTIKKFQEEVAMLAHDWLAERVSAPELGG